MAEGQIAVRIHDFIEEALIIKSFGVSPEQLDGDLQVALSWEPLLNLNAEPEILSLRLQVKFLLPTTEGDQSQPVIQYQLLGSFEAAGLRALQPEQEAGWGGDLNLPFPMITAFLDVLVGTARGLLTAHLRGTVFRKIFIPMTDAGQLAALRLQPPIAES
jgi:hypothetical protein